MNPVLVQAVRERMRDRSTDDLRELWQTNDRAHWSSETFEAVKSLLAERGVTDLPPQNDPAPIARPHLPSDVPENVYWLGWLRPALWVGIGIATLTLLQQAASLWLVRDTVSVSHFLDQPWDLFIGTLDYALLPAALIAGAIGCLRLMPTARVILIAYGWTQIAVVCVSVFQSVWQVGVYGQRDFYELTTSLGSVHYAVLPAVLLGLLRRPEIRAIFTTARPGGGFDPKLPAEAPAGQDPN